jgi:VRR-NUC domain
VTKAKRKKRVRIRLVKRLESSVETSSLDAIEERYPGCLIRKLNGGGNRNWPDRMILFPNGLLLLIEFKRPGEELRPGQAWLIDKIRTMGFYVAVCDSKEGALHACEAIHKVNQ